MAFRNWRSPIADLGRTNRRIFWALVADEGAAGATAALIPLLAVALGATPLQAGAVLASIGLARIVGPLPSGFLAARLPPGPIVVGGRTLGAVALLLFAAADAWWHLLFGAVAYAGSIAAWPTVSATVAGSAADGAARMRAFVLCYTVAPALGLLATPALGGAVAEAAGFRAAFLLGAAIRVGSIAIFATVRWQRPAAATGRAGSFLGALALPALRRLVLLYIGFVLALEVGWVLIPNFLEEVRGWSVAAIGWFGTAAAIGGVVLAVAAERAPALRSPLRVVAAGVAATGVSFALLLAGSSAATLIVAGALSGGYAVAAGGGFYAALGDAVPASHRTHAYALPEMIYGVATAVGPLAAGWLYAADPRLPLAAGLVLVVPLLAAIAVIGRRQERPAPGDRAPAEDVGEAGSRMGEPGESLRAS